MTEREDVDAVAELLLRTYNVITVVGASADPAKAANSVPAHMQAHGWRIIPVNPTAASVAGKSLILGEPAFARLADVDEPLGLVDVFRPSAATPDVARQAVAAGAKALWLQLGIASAEAREIATAAGLTYIENRCLIIERSRLGLSAPR